MTEEIKILIERVKILQFCIEGQTKEVETATATLNELNNQLSECKAKLLELVDTDDALECGDTVCRKFYKSNVGYTSDADVLKCLKESFDGNYIKVKTTESLDKVPLKKALKTNQELATALQEFIVNSTTPYIVVTSKENYDKMLEHMEEGK